MTKTDQPAAPLQTVLVVEDEILIRFQLAAYLHDCGYRVIEAAHAGEAVLVLNEPDLLVDMVLSDVEMPGEMDGFALARWIRKERPGLPVILAGSPARAADAAADLCEAGPTLAKPYEPQVLLDRIKSTLAETARSAKRRLDGKPE